MTDEKVADGLVVSIAYVLKADGAEVDRTDKDDPLVYLHGARNIIPALESALAGKKAGDKFRVTLKPEDAYGPYDEQDVERIERAALPDASTLQKGMVVELEDEEGDVFLATVTEVTPDAIVLDFNPPLAGKTLTFEGEIVGVRLADPTELQHGHVHGPDDDDDDYDEDDDYDSDDDDYDDEDDYDYDDDDEDDDYDDDDDDDEVV